jgi:hypothetical protein
MEREKKIGFVKEHGLFAGFDVAKKRNHVAQFIDKEGSAGSQRVKILQQLRGICPSERKGGEVKR